MRGLLMNCVFATALLGGCGPKSSISLVVVTVDADAPIADVSTLHARVTVADQTREFDVHPSNSATLSIPPAQSFGIDIPRSMTGTLSIHVEAHDANGNLVASGDGSGAIRVGARADVAIRLLGIDNGVDLGSTDGGMAIPPGSDLAQPSGDMIVIPPAMLTIDKTMQSFGDITVGKTSTTASFLVVNAGGMPSSVATLLTTGANLSEFSIATDCGSSLAPGSRCHVTASITPTSPGAKSASFTLGAAQGGTVGGSLSANALTPGAVKIVQSSGDCGSALLGTQSATTASFTVQNSGASPTSALTVAMSDAQFVAGGCSGTTLAAGAMCTVTVKFTPTAPGTQNASLTVSASTGGTDTASVVGVGLKPASLKVTPTSYSFPNVARGAAGDTATFTVANGGDVASQTLSAATVTGANSSSFVITADNCKGAPVGPAPATCTILIQFAPAVAGSNNATLNIPSSGLPAVTLTGTGNPTWVSEAAPAGTPGLSAVWAVDPDNVYAVGKAGTILYRGKSGVWTAQSLAGTSPPDLTSVSGAASTNIFVAGGSVYQSAGNGQWSSVLASGPFTGVWAFNGADVWATWDTGTSDSNANAAYHYTPATGWKLARDAAGAPLHGSTFLWGTSSSDLFVYGGYLRFEISINAYVTGGSIFHLDGAGHSATQFNQMKTVVPIDVSMAVRSLWGSGAPANNLYAVTTVFSGSNHSDVILHSTSGVWDQMPSPAPTVVCDAVWGYDSTHVLFGCADGVHQYDGTSWTLALPSTNRFYGISGSNVNAPNVFAVGASADGTAGVIYHYY